MDQVELLLIEDDAVDAQMIELVLGRAFDMQIAFDHVTTLRDGIAALHNKPRDVVLLDLGLPDSWGVGAISRLKTAAPLTPIVVLSGHDDDETALAAITSGAQEYLSKEHVMGHLLTRVVRHSIARQQQLLKAQAQALEDPLTGLGNRRAFDLELARRTAEWERHQIPFSVALFDVDHFKQINDRWGHERGDQVLTRVGTLLREQARQTDLVARYGGEEFAFVFSSTDVSKAFEISQRIITAIATSCGSHIDPAMTVTISGGVASVSHEVDPSDVVRQADAALYAAKDQGRNRCLLAQSLVGTPG